MSGECDRCGWHCLECICAHPPSQAISDELVETWARVIYDDQQTWKIPQQRRPWESAKPADQVVARSNARAAVEASGIQRLLEREERQSSRILELETRLRTIYWMDAKNAGLSDEDARENADARLSARTTLSGEGAGEGLR